VGEWVFKLPLKAAKPEGKEGLRTEKEQGSL
jgi:hypothetical protein